MALERTKYCCVSSPRFGDDNMLPEAMQRKVNFKRLTKFLILELYLSAFQEPGPGLKFKPGLALIVLQTPGF